MSTRLPSSASRLAVASLLLTAACASSSRAGGGDTTPAPSTGAPAAGSGTATAAPLPSPAVSGDSTAAAAPATPAAPAGGTHWMGDIKPKAAGTVSGSAMVMPATTAGQSTASVTLATAPASATLPWHVHSGTCAETGAIVGPASAYTPITTDAAGAGKVEAALPFPTPASGTYSVNVHASPTQMGTIIACADLRSGTM